MGPLAELSKIGLVVVPTSKGFALKNSDLEKFPASDIEKIKKYVFANRFHIKRELQGINRRPTQMKEIRPMAPLSPLIGRKEVAVDPTKPLQAQQLPKQQAPGLPPKVFRQQPQVQTQDLSNLSSARKSSSCSSCSPPKASVSPPFSSATPDFSNSVANVGISASAVVIKPGDPGFEEALKLSQKQVKSNEQRIAMEQEKLDKKEN